LTEVGCPNTSLLYTGCSVVIETVTEVLAFALRHTLLYTSLASFRVFRSLDVKIKSFLAGFLAE
jgi:hypothetical protein